MDPKVLLIVLLVGGTYYGGVKVRNGVKHAAHKVEQIFHHKQPVPKPEPPK